MSPASFAGKDGKPRRGKPYKRDFGVPPAKAQDSFTDPESRIMKRAGGGFDYCFNAQTAVDEAALFHRNFAFYVFVIEI